MKKILSVILALSLMLASVSAFALTAGEYVGEAQGFGGTVTVKITVDNAAVTAAEITADNETAAIGGAAAESLAAAMIGATSADDIEVITGATITSTAVKEALGKDVTFKYFV